MQAIQERFVNIELLRFTNSGTEANLMAITLARAFTKRPKVDIVYLVPSFHPHTEKTERYDCLSSRQRVLSSRQNTMWAKCANPCHAGHGLLWQLSRLCVHVCEWHRGPRQRTLRLCHGQLQRLRRCLCCVHFPSFLHFSSAQQEYSCAGVEALMQEHGAQLACVLVELMTGAGGCIPAKPELLATLTRCCNEAS